MAREKIRKNGFNGISFYAKAIAISITIMVVLIPTVFYPYLPDMFNHPKALALEIFTLIGLLFWSLRLLTQEEFTLTSTPLNFPICCFMLAGIFSLFRSDSPMVSLQALPFFLAGPVLFFTVVNNIESKKQVSHIFLAVLITGTLFGIYGILQYLGKDLPFWEGADPGRKMVFGLFGNVNYFAEYLLFPLTLAIPLFFVARNKWVKFLLLAGIFTMGSSLLFTFTRGAYLGFALALVFMFFVFLRWQGRGVLKKYRKLFISFILLALIICLIIFVPSPLNEKGTFLHQLKTRVSLSGLATDTSAFGRITIWKFTALMIKDHPILGSGLGTFAYNSIRYQARLLAQAESHSLYVRGVAAEAHNDYLQLWAELGIIGLGIFICIVMAYYNYLLAYLKREKEKKKQIPGSVLAAFIGLMGAVTAVLTDAIFNFPFHLPASFFLFWLFLALGVVLVKQESYGEVENSRNSSAKLPQKLKEEISPKTEQINIARKKVLSKRFKYLLFPIIIFTILATGILAVRPFIAEMYRYDALQSIKEKQVNRAIKQYEKSLKWNPYSGLSYSGIGEIILQEGFAAVSLPYFEKAAHYIDHPNLPARLAYLYLKEGMVEQAIPKLETAIMYQGQKAKKVPLYNELGKAYLQIEKYSDAEMAFRQVKDITGEDAFAYLGLAQALLKQNKTEEAKIELDTLISLAPDSPEAAQARTLLDRLSR